MTILHHYFLNLVVLLIGIYPIQGDNEFEIINEIIRSNAPLYKTVPHDRKAARQAGDRDVVEEVSTAWTSFAKQITGVLDNITLDNFLLESSKRIPEDTRASLEEAIKNLPEPLVSLLRGPLEQINEFLQIGRAPSTTEPPYLEEASTFEPDYYTVAPVARITTTDSSGPLNYTQRVFTETNSQNTAYLPNTPNLEDIPNLPNKPSVQNALNLQNTTLLPFLNRNRKTTVAPNKNPNSLSNLMLLVNNQPISNLFENVSNTIQNTKPEIDNSPTEASVAQLFANISTQFQSTESSQSATNGEPPVDDEDESLPVFDIIKRTNASVASNTNNNSNKFSNLHKQLVTELKTLANASGSSQQNYKTGINFPDNQISSGSYPNSEINSNGQQFSNIQGYPDPNGQQFFNNQGYQNSNEQQFFNNQGYQNSNGQQFSDIQGYQNSNGQQFSNNQGYQNSNGQQFSDIQGYQNSIGQISNNQGQGYPSPGNVNRVGTTGQLTITEDLSQLPPQPRFPAIQIITLAADPVVTVATTQRAIKPTVVSTATEDEDDGEDEDSSST